MNISTVIIAIATLIASAYAAFLYHDSSVERVAIIEERARVEEKGKAVDAKAQRAIAAARARAAAKPASVLESFYRD